MARPIKEPPILYGEDTRRFLERMKNPIKEEREKPDKLYWQLAMWWRIRDAETITI